jgi:hypothetical protein
VNGDLVLVTESIDPGATEELQRALLHRQTLAAQ